MNYSTKMLINGKLVEGEGKRLDVLNPATGMPWAAIQGSGTGCDMSVYALDAYTSIRHVMFAHGE